MSIPVNEVFDLEEEIAERQIDIDLLQPKQRSARLILQNQKEKKPALKKSNKSIALLSEKKLKSQMILSDFRRHEIKRMSK